MNWLRKCTIVVMLCACLGMVGCMTTGDGEPASMRIDWDSVNAGIEAAERLVEVYVRISAMLRDLEELQDLRAEDEAAEAAIEREDQIATLKENIEMLLDTADRLRSLRDEAPDIP